MPRVSVVIPAYNYAQFLPNAIDSALGQTFRDCEIIVVDDGSTDNTAELASRYEGKIRYHRQANHGLSAARNAGCRLASGELFAFLDADDQWDPEKIERQVAVLDAFPQAALVSTYMRFMDAGRKPLPGRKPAAEPGETLADIIERGTAAPSSFIVRRDCFEGIQGFDERLTAMEDLDFCLRLAQTRTIKHIHEELGSYRVHGPSLSGNPAKVYPSYIAIYQRLLEDPSARQVRGMVRKKLARYSYLWGIHQLKANSTIEGKRWVRAAIAASPLVGWSIDASRPWWIRLINTMKPYAASVSPGRKARVVTNV